MLIDSARNNIKYVIDIMCVLCALCSIPSFNRYKYEFLYGIAHIFFLRS